MNDKQATAIKQVNCPNCKKIVNWLEDNIYRPFCSKKCQLLDFGDWASERNTIPVADNPEDFNLDIEINGQENEGDF